VTTNLMTNNLNQHKIIEEMNQIRKDLTEKTKIKKEQILKF